MAQFDVCENLGDSAGKFPWLMILQSDLLRTTGTQIIAPLDRSTLYERSLRVYPEVTIEGERWLIILPFMAAVPDHCVGQAVGRFDDVRHEVITAIDRIFTGLG